MIRNAPAYRAIRTDRYLFVVYANGQTELYDMRRDPAQLRSLASDKRFRFVRKWLFDQMVPLSSCAGPSCRVEVGVEPPPLSKSAVRPKRKKKATARVSGPGGQAGGQGRSAAEAVQGYDSPPGALAKLAKAPASKAGDSRFESWVPR